MPDEEVAAELVAVKGLGQWTADMFLMFHLGRPDVLPVGDLGISRAVERAYGLPGLPDPAELTRDRRALAPTPHAGAYLWRSLDEPRGPGLSRSGSVAAGGEPAAPLQTAETSCSSATRNEEPQPQAAITFGFSTLKPAPWRSST